MARAVKPHMEVRNVTYARKSLVSLKDTCFYHVVARCVRRAWLWGGDANTGRDYSHRKQWVLDRLRLLSSMFAIDVCAHAIMSNHYHLVLHVNTSRAQNWTQREVVEQWMLLYRATPAVASWLKGEARGAVRAEAEACIEKWRKRLQDISWFMRCLNEYLARRANAEDNCKGRFWEGRFKSQALLDEAGVLTAMAYVDLNPVRAGIAASAEECDFTSIYERIRELKGSCEAGVQGNAAAPRIRLLPFKSSDTKSGAAIPFSLHSYVELLRWTGSRIAAEQDRASDADIPPLLGELKVDPGAWVRAMCPRGNVFGRALGRLDRLRLHARTVGQSWIRGVRQAQQLYCA